MKPKGPQPISQSVGEQTVEFGFVIMTAQNRVWGDMLFADEDAANMTAARCVADAQIVEARKVSYVDYPPSAPRIGKQRVQFILAAT